MNLPKSEKQLKADFKAIPDIQENAKKEIGEQLRKIKEYEQKFKDQWKFEGDALNYFSIVFKSKEERACFCKKYDIKLRYDDHVMIDDVLHLFKEK